MALIEGKRIDQKRARDHVKNFFKNYFYFYKVVFEIRVNSDWRLTLSTDNLHLDFWEDIEKRKSDIETVKKVIDAINALGWVERKIIIKRFAFNNGEYDYEIADEMKITLRSYERYKALAIHNLAVGLNFIKFEN